MGINISRSKGNVHYNPVLKTNNLIRQTKHVNCKEDSNIKPLDIITNDNNNQVELNRFFTEGDHTTYDINDNGLTNSLYDDGGKNEFLQNNLHENEIYKMLQQDTPCTIIKNNYIPSNIPSVVLQKYHHDDGDNKNSQRLLNMQNEDNHCSHRFKFTSPSFLSIQRKKSQIKAINQRPAWKPAFKVNYTKNTNADYNDEVNRKFKQLHHQNNFQPTICYNKMETPSSLCSISGDNSYYSLNNTAHIRRCKTAQLIKIDEGIRELESIKGSRSMKPNSRHLFIKSKSTKHNKQDMIEMENFKNEISTQSKNDLHSSYLNDQIKMTRNTEPNVSQEEQQSSKETNDAGKTSTRVNNNCNEISNGKNITYHMNQIQKSDLLPLHYVFYVEDNQKTLKAFVHGGKISSIAYDTQCHVYYHARHKHIIQSVKTCEQNMKSVHAKKNMKYASDDYDNNSSISSSNTIHNSRITEPALFYQGKQVRPVTVAAPNIHKLKQFLEMLDMHYPEFEASAFLYDHLV
ncbi:unnamed protein product [Trichobilharzia szidati]|nr:unnamed protein product [Trichobilharzia szidati]